MKRKFTLPGEAGYEALTLSLAKRWGADVIRDSDGTALSREILDAGYKIYSTICPIREHNPWIKENMHARQQTFLSTPETTATDGDLQIPLMGGFFAEQFSINDSEGALKYWQVYDRTSDTPIVYNPLGLKLIDMSGCNYTSGISAIQVGNSCSEELPPITSWSYNNGVVTIKNPTPFRQYTVSFLAWRDWEEISMYNHTTNDWDKEKLMQLNPYAPGAMDYLKNWFIQWCENNPHADVVRFTSLFYNFAWIWGSSERNRHLFTDWASYDFTVSVEALDDFYKEYGYKLTAEDFVRQGKYNATHRVPSQKKRDWMEFIGAYVRRATRELVDIIHAAGKKAYVFYDDSWVGMEPYNGKFGEMAFDGLIKCVFSGYEARLCAGVDVPVHEIRFHPYLFPVGLGGAPTFSPGGKPGEDAMGYWIGVRRALLRAKIERSGLGGYLHLVQDYPDFTDAMDTILAEFDTISVLHDAHGSSATLKPKIGILHAWGALRTWTLSGHFHETDGHVLIHVLEALSGLPFEVEFFSFEDIENGIPDSIDIIINAGEAGSAWSGGEYWRNDALVQTLTGWVHGGGVFVGIGEPSAVDGFARYMRMAHVMGVDIDNGERTCHGRWSFTTEPEDGVETAIYKHNKTTILTDGNARVLASASNVPIAVINKFGEGCGVYLSGFEFAPASAHALASMLIFAATGSVSADGMSSNPYVECAIFPEKIIFINNVDTVQQAICNWQGKTYDATIDAYGMTEISIV